MNPGTIEEHSMFKKIQFRVLAAMAVIALGSSASNAVAQKKYDTGASDTEIKIGQTMPYSGPASAYGTIGKVYQAYFDMLNAQGGINGRKIKFISLDDGYTPPRTVEQIRKLVEQEQVLLLFGTLGTPTNSAIHKYVNQKKIPHLFLNTGATKWNDPKNYPWTMGWNLSYQTEGKIYAKYLLQTKPDAKVAILYQNDDYGKDYVKGLKDGLGDKAAKMIVSEVSYEVTDPTIDSQIATLKGSGADTFFNVTTPKFAAQAIRKVADIGWKPLHLLNNVSSSVGAVLTPAGFDKSVGLITANSYKDAVDPQWKDDAAIKAYVAFMKKYYQGGDISDVFNIVGYANVQVLVHVLKACGDDLTREHIMKQAASIKDLQIDVLLPGVKINTSADDYSVLSQAQLSRFDGKEWKLFGEVLGGK
jgi:branched-chain amino acid transport system substrate-binding protein